MRRYLFLAAVLQGLLLQSGTYAGAAHGHVRAAPAHAPQARHGGSAKPVVAFTGRRRTSHGRAARRKLSRLQTVQPVTTALIDPVPRGKFPFLPPLKGSHDSLVRQNLRSEEDGLERIQDDADLVHLRQEKQLVALPVAAGLTVDERLPANRRYCRVWTAQFLSDLSMVHYGRFRRPLQVNSAVRTVEYQRHLEMVNGNAAPADGDIASPHLTGGTIDIAKRGLSMSEVGWLRAYLAPLQAAGKIDVEEEFYQSCFHISVYRSYQSHRSATQADLAVAAHHGGNAAVLAAGMR
jgi:hypothetical protein